MWRNTFNPSKIREVLNLKTSPMFTEQKPEAHILHLERDFPPNFKDQVSLLMFTNPQTPSLSSVTIHFMHQ